MIYGYLHQGSGIGNQLHRMIAVRVKALDLGVEWRLIWNPDNSGKEKGFKAKSFIPFDESKIIYEKPLEVKEWSEKKLVENGIDIRSYDPEFNFVEDNTLIEGEFQDERYFEHHLKEVNEWLKVEPLFLKSDICVIGFRGGEFQYFPDLFLSSEYWDLAIMVMRGKNKNMKFEVHTDDVETAKRVLEPLFTQRNLTVPYFHEPSLNWRSMRFAKYAIISNSSFFILSRLLREAESDYQTDKTTSMTIAPRYWGRRNTKVWCLPQNYYKRFFYI